MKNIHKIIFIVAIVAMVSCEENGPKEPQATSDELWAMNVAVDQRAEIDLGVLAREHGDNVAIREFGMMMDSVHTAALSELQSIADQKNITLPQKLDSTHQALKLKLMMLSGMAFDTTYINSQISDHEKAISDFETESNTGEDPELVAYATNHIAALHEHLAKAQQTKAIVMGQITAAGPN